MDQEITLKRTLFGGFKRNDIINYIDELRKENEKIKREYQKEISLMKSGNADVRNEQETFRIKELESQLKAQQEENRRIQLTNEQKENVSKDRIVAQEGQSGKIQMYPGNKVNSINKQLAEELALTDGLYIKTGSGSSNYIPIPIEKSKEQHTDRFIKKENHKEEEKSDTIEDSISQILKHDWREKPEHNPDSYILNDLYDEINKLRNKLENQEMVNNYKQTILDLQNENKRLRRKLEKEKLKNRELEAQLNFAGQMIIKRRRFL